MIAPGLRQDGQDDFTRVFGQLEIAVGIVTSEKEIGRPLVDLGQSIATHSREEMSKVLAVDIPVVDPAVARFQLDFVANNVKLIKSVAYEQLDLMKSLVSSATTDGLSQGQLKRLIEERFGVTESRAQLIARDQTLKANAQLNQLRSQRAGVTRYQWETARDERVRGRPGGKWPKGDHWDLHGTVHEWSQPPIVDSRTGRKGHPGEDYQCRCVAIPLVDDLLYAE